MKEYNGHRSWNAWNVSLWISNDEGLYNYALECIERARKTLQNRGKQSVNPAHLAARIFMGDFSGSKTPDGASYNFTSVKIALCGLIES